MKYITTLKAITILSFLILSAVQYFLVYNTYELENEHYYLSEKSILNEDYSRSIRNDVIFPGGIRIVDSLIYNNLPSLESFYRKDPKAFNRYKQELCNQIFQALAAANTMDSTFQSFITHRNLDKNLTYRLTVKLLEFAFEANRYVTLYNKNITYPLIQKDIQTDEGILIGGTLKDANSQNSISTITVGSSAARTYRIAFGLYADTTNRQATILKKMMPTLLLSLFSIFFVITLFFITFRNWIRQKKLSEMKSDFINSITHEFNTPLTAIIVANKNLQTDKLNTSKQNIQSLAGVIQRQAERLRILITQVLDITTMNKVIPEKSLFSLHKLLEEIIQDYQLKITDPNIHIHLKRAAVRDAVLLDRFWFTTLLINMMDNAIKYNDKAVKEITITTGSNRKYLHLSISDNGMGMSAETQQHIFDKFFRYSKNVGGNVKGLGLGLYYAKQVADAHNWKIEIESAPGVGSSFKITIPF